MPIPEEGTPELDIQTPQDWQEEQVDWEKRFKDASAEITRARQELAEYKRQSTPQAQAQWDDPEQVKAYLRQQWFITREELESQSKFNDILAYNPELSKFADFIKTAAQNENLAYEDVIQKYWLSTSDKLAKAKSRSLPWNNLEQPKDKWVFDLTEEEWAAFQKSEMNKDRYSVQPSF